MTPTTAQAFATFLENITATGYQKNVLIPARTRTVDERLFKRFPSTSDMPYAGGILIGSASKGTVIRPVDDVDVLAVFDNVNNAWSKYWNDSKSFIYRIRDAYNGISIQQVGTRGQAVRVFYDGGGHVDVAPVFRGNGEVYNLPDGAGGWIQTAPILANSWFMLRNRELNYQLGPLIRIAKSWNRAHSKRMRSFHLETVAAKTFATLGANHRMNLQHFFEWAPNWLTVSDPGGQGGDLSSYLTFSGRQELLKAFRSAADRASSANAAEARGDHEEAKRLWRIILGGDFPTS